MNPDERPPLHLRGALKFAPAPESVPVPIAPRYGHFIDGRFVDGDDPFPVIEPGTGQPLTQVASARPDEIDAAVRAARAAFPKWSGLPALERGKYLNRIARRLQDRARAFAVVETRNNGKPIRETRDVVVPLAAQHFFYYAGWAD